MEEVTQVTNEVQNTSDSYFDGGVFQLLGWRILGSLVTGITLGICYPFAVNWLYSWEAKHTVIEGRRLKFTGSAGGLFGTWILCILLSIITLGIYAFYIPIKIKRWREANTFFEDEIPTFDAEQNLRKEKASYFDGGFWQLFGWTLLGALITFFTLGICYPWAIKMIFSWEQRHKVYCKRRCTFDGTAMQLFGTWILCMLLSVITLGIYTWWIPIKIKKWQIKHTHLLENDSPAEEQEYKELTPEEIEEKEKNNTQMFKWFYFGASVYIVLFPFILTASYTCFTLRGMVRHLQRYFNVFNILIMICAVGMIVFTFIHIKHDKWLKLGLLVAICLLHFLPTFICISSPEIFTKMYLEYSAVLHKRFHIFSVLLRRIPIDKLYIWRTLWDILYTFFEIAIVMAFIGWFKTKDLDSLDKKDNS